MININNKPWDKLTTRDIKAFLVSFENESIFYELKNENIDGSKLAKEVAALSNTYGGYIFLGIDDDKTISGCTKWNEQRIHKTIYDTVIPTPNVDVRRFRIDGNTIYVIRIEEGSLPPYVTNKGIIYSRLSSGSCPVNEQSKLNILYMKRQDQIQKIKDKIELPEVINSTSIPNNLCAYIDLGFSLSCSQPISFQKGFYDFDWSPVIDYFKTRKINFTISRVGDTYLITVGPRYGHVQSGNNQVPVFLSAGLNNFIEIMYDGSIRSRIILSNDGETGVVDVLPILSLNIIYEDIYAMIINSEIEKIFVNAHKYSYLHVIKQFSASFDTNLYTFASPDSEFIRKLSQANCNHREKYMSNYITNSNRIPRSNYLIIDRAYFDHYSINYNFNNLIKELFYFDHKNLGFIDKILI